MTRAQTDEFDEEADQNDTAKRKLVWSRRVFVNGATLEVAVFERIGKGRKGSFRAFNVTMQRQYQDGNDDKLSRSFRSDDLPHLFLLCSQAYGWFCDQNARPRSGSSRK